MTSTGLANPRTLAWLGIGLVGAGLLWLLSSILAPFLAGAILAYILNPLANRLSGRFVGRTTAVLFVLVMLVLLMVALLLVVLPLFYKEAVMMSERLPAVLDWLNDRVAPWVLENLGFALQFDLESFKQLAAKALHSKEDLATRLLGSLQIGGLALLGFAVNLILVPVVLFYLLRDWNEILERLERMIPRRMHDTVLTLAREVDAVLAEFLRGQITVILVMIVYFTTALWLTGLTFALPIGIITGALVFIPYVGAFAGFFLGSVAALLQFDSFTGLLFVWLAFGIGQMLEGMVVTPWLVGQRIGLHPLAVIFALLAFGQVFGFFGVLLALPASAALLVGLRHMRTAYLSSELYGDSSDQNRGPGAPQ